MCRFSQASTHLLLILAVFGTHHHAVPNQVAASPLYPSNSFGPSMRASATASTIIAVTAPASNDDEAETASGECCVILTKSHMQSGGKRESGDANGGGGSDVDDDGDGGVTVASAISVASESPELHPESDLQPITRPGRHTPTLSVLSTGSNNVGTPPLLAAFTGFTPDVHHLSLRLAKTYSSHLHLYGGIPMRTDRAAQNLADVVRSAASGEGRPYGVQALVVGDRPRSQQLQLYTIDPAGGCTHWSGGGTAIGKDAELVRKCLLRCLRPNEELKNLSPGVIAEELKQLSAGVIAEELKRLSAGVVDDEIESFGASRGPPKCWQDALDRAMMATLEATLTGDMDEAAVEDWMKNWEFNSDSIRATVAFTGRCSVMASTNSKVFVVSSKVLRDSYERCMESLAYEQMKRLLR